jgi:hypothetical protein
MAEHELKTWSKYFAAVLSGEKPFELRRGDRPFAVGDTLRLREWDPDREDYTGREVCRVVSYVLRGEYWFGLLDGFVILGLESGERSSRQAWAEAAAALKQAARDSYGELGLYIGLLSGTSRPEVVGRRVAAVKAQKLIGDYFGAVMPDWHDPDDRRVCACPTDEQLSKLDSGFTRPQCTVHPENGGA